MSSSPATGSSKRNNDPTAARAGSYAFWSRELVRFADLDLNGHVNNIAFAVYGESGRVAFLRAIGFWSPADATRQNVVAHMEIDYLHELRYPADLRVGVRVRGIGRSSFQLEVGLFLDQQCVATVRTVQVRIDAVSKAPVPLSEQERETLRPYLSGPDTAAGG